MVKIGYFVSAEEPTVLCRTVRIHQSSVHPGDIPCEAGASFDEVHVLAIGPRHREMVDSYACKVLPRLQ